MGQLSSHVFIVIQPDHLVKSTIFCSCESIRKLLFAFLIDKSFKINYYPIHIKLFFKQKFHFDIKKKKDPFILPLPLAKRLLQSFLNSTKKRKKNIGIQGTKARSVVFPSKEGATIEKGSGRVKRR